MTLASCFPSLGLGHFLTADGFLGLARGFTEMPQKSPPHRTWHETIIGALGPLLVGGGVQFPRGPLVTWGWMFT